MQGTPEQTRHEVVKLPLTVIINGVTKCASIIQQGVSNLIYLGLSLEPIIRFLETKFSISEPKEAGTVATVRIPVVRLGDTSKMSVVRVHTKDGSAVSGEDYYPVSRGAHTCCGCLTFLLLFYWFI